MDSTYLGYARRGITTWWRYPAALVLGLVLTIVAGAVVIAVGEVAHLTPPDLIEQMQHPSRPITFYAITGVMFGLTLLGFALAIRGLHRKRFGDILGVWSWRAYLAGFGVWAVVLAASALIDLAIAPSGFAFTGRPAVAQVAAAALVALVIQTFTEEFIFRGYLTQGLMLALKQPLPAAVLSGLIFGAMHIPNGAPQAASAVVFGVAVALIAVRTGGVAFGSGLHLANNLFAAVVLVSRGDVFQSMPGLFTQDTPQLMWWDAMVGSVAVVLLAVVMLRRGRAAA